MAGALIEYRRDGHVGLVTLNRPETGNALSQDMLRALDRALIAAEEDIDAKIVLLQADGPDFSVDAELDEPEAALALGGPGARLVHETHQVRRFEYIVNFPRPTIAVVRGRCAGVGLTLAMCCDFVICSDDARLSDPAVTNGNTPTFALWPFYAWHKKAKEILFGGELSGATAAEWGLVTSSVPAGQLEAEVKRYVEMLLLAPADALVWMKEMISATLEARGGGIMWRDSAVYQALGAGPQTVSA
jgi:enoyl-CoA hydratase